MRTRKRLRIACKQRSMAFEQLRDERLFCRLMTKKRSPRIERETAAKLKSVVHAQSSAVYGWCCGLVELVTEMQLATGTGKMEKRGQDGKEGRDGSDHEDIEEFGEVCVEPYAQ